jgi:hypothetical protein
VNQPLRSALLPHQSLRSGLLTISPPLSLSEKKHRRRHRRLLSLLSRSLSWRLKAKSGIRRRLLQYLLSLAPFPDGSVRWADLGTKPPTPTTAVALAVTPPFPLSPWRRDAGAAHTHPFSTGEHHTSPSP